MKFNEQKDDHYPISSSFHDRAEENCSAHGLLAGLFGKLAIMAKVLLVLVASVCHHLALVPSSVDTDTSGMRYISEQLPV